MGAYERVNPTMLPIIGLSILSCNTWDAPYCVLCCELPCAFTRMFKPFEVLLRVMRLALLTRHMHTLSSHLACTCCGDQFVVLCDPYSRSFGCIVNFRQIFVVSSRAPFRRSRICHLWCTQAKI